MKNIIIQNYKPFQIREEENLLKHALTMFPSDRHQYFSLRWNNYQNNMTSVFHQLLENQSFVDVTLACENNFLKAHKVGCRL